jgi:hypothetical protein
LHSNRTKKIALGVRLGGGRPGSDTARAASTSRQRSEEEEEEAEEEGQSAEERATSRPAAAASNEKEHRRRRSDDYAAIGAALLGGLHTPWQTPATKAEEAALRGFRGAVRIRTHLKSIPGWYVAKSSLWGTTTPTSSAIDFPCVYRRVPGGLAPKSLTRMAGDVGLAAEVSAFSLGGGATEFFLESVAAGGVSALVGSWVALRDARGGAKRLRGG